MTENEFHARRTELANAMAAAGAELLDFMGAAGALAAIPNTQQYVVAGDPRAIRAQLDTVDPQRRMRHGDRPSEPLYFGPEAGQPRRWAALITSAGHGMLQEYGTRFEFAQPGQEVLEVMEMLPGIANKAAEEGELPAGFAIVPIKPTEEMLSAVVREDDVDEGLKELFKVSFAKDFEKACLAAVSPALIAADRAARTNPEQEPVAWMRDNRAECCTDRHKKWAESAGFGVWDQVAASYTIPLFEGVVVNADRTARAGAAPSAPVGAVPSIDTPEFDKLLNEYADWQDGETTSALIAHIDQHVASQVRAARDAQRPTDDHLWNETIRDRDTYHEWADKLAEAISKHFGAYIGEHSNANCPWAEALEAIESAPAISHSGEGSAP